MVLQTRQILRKSWGCFQLGIVFQRQLVLLHKSLLLIIFRSIWEVNVHKILLDVRSITNREQPKSAPASRPEACNPKYSRGLCFWKYLKKKCILNIKSLNKSPKKIQATVINEKHRHIRHVKGRHLEKSSKNNWSEIKILRKSDMKTRPCRI